MQETIPNEYIERIIHLYVNEEKSGPVIAEELGISKTSVYNILRRNDIIIKRRDKPFESCRKKAICEACGKEFIKKSALQKYCQEPCNYRYAGMGKVHAMNYLYINSIRRTFYHLCKSNPDKAKEYQLSMLEEEGPEFTQKVLGDILQRKEFIHIKEIYDKYKNLWENE